MKVNEFLEKENLNVQSLDFSLICNKFLEEMGKGLYGKESSLPMIPAYCNTDLILKPGQTVMVLDAGGTNLRSCLLTFDENLKPQISNFKKVQMPGIDRDVSKKDFFSIFADQIERFNDTGCKRLGICFSYASRISQDLDGYPLFFSKEIKANEVIGQPIAKTLIAELKNRGMDTDGMKYAVVNDTVATLLAGKSVDNIGYYSSFIGYILGTGTNTAYLEKNSLIGKEKTFTEGNQIINVESGCFDLILNEIDQNFINQTKVPGSSHFEKMISGAYLGKESLLVIKAAAQANVFSEEVKEKLLALKDLNTIEMSHFLEEPYNKNYKLVKIINGNKKDSTSLYILLKAHVKRAAFLSAANLTAVMLKTDQGLDPCHPICINADGTTFYKTEFLKEYTDYYLHLFLTEKFGISYRFIQVDNSPIIGAAIAALSK